MSGEKSRIVRVTASVEYEYFNTESIEEAERMAFADAEEELGSIYAGKWTIELAEYQREREY